MNSIISAQSRIQFIGQNKQPTYNRFLKKFESQLTQWYPFGQETTFRLNHGTNYFAFFNRMGKVYYYVLYHITNSLIAGSICFVLRKINDQNCAFYLCDLKFDTSMRKTGMLKHLFLRSIPFCLTKTFKFYAISMNSQLEENKILQMAKHMGQQNFGKIKVNIQQACILNIYSFTYDQMCQFEKYITVAKQNVNTTQKIRYLSLKNIKDIIIKKNNEQEEMKMPLLHLHYFISEYDDLSIGSYYTKPQKNHTHMFCTVQGGVLARFLQSKHNILPDSNATVMHYNLQKTDWEFVQTCDI